MTLEVMERVIKHIDSIPEEEMFINKGPTQENLDAYISSMKKIDNSIQELLQLNLKSVEKSIIQLRALYKKANSKLEAMFRTLLSINSNIIDPVTTIKQKGVNGLKIKEDILKILKVLTSILAEEIRSFYLVKSLYNSSQSCLLNTTKRTSLDKFSHPFSTFTDCTLSLIKVEYELIQFLFKDNPNSILQRSMKASMDMFKHTVDSLTTEKKASFANDYSEMILLLDFCGYLSNTLQKSDKDLIQLTNLEKIHSDLLKGSSSLIPEFLESIKVYSAKNPTLAQSATVHEVSSNRLSDYEKEMEIVLSNYKQGFSMNVFLESTLECLQASIDHRSKNYKKQLNNFHYIHKNLKTQFLSNHVSVKLIDKFNELQKSQRDLYLLVWKPVIENCNNLSMTKISSKSDKLAVKEMFKGFYNDLEESIKVQRSLSIPDTDLKFQLIREVKEMVIPKFMTFCETYVPFTKKTQKYFRYDSETLDAILGRLFEA
ncbi:hypothetical protein ROZALSC1DRAFT_29341 [Rozella allomycis CSF55]|uniref:Exocyst complex protein EXO70 n=1 Tax=Rozella allomycis (strain CSF55) TaxID=988480 RepID=A0A4V1IZR9_ROZAC|nr:hypothetical protein ROZALSC1DRAFT_29341 [Rozella allomycis CSF55]